MHSSTSKDKEPLTTSTAQALVSLKQEPGDAAEGTVIKRKTQRRRKRRHDPSELLLFSDPLDGTSSDEQSFDEEDMFGSDSDAETISLGFRSKDQKQLFDDQVVCIIISGHLVQECLQCSQDDHPIPQFQDMSMDLRNISAMMEALCEAEGIDVSSMTAGLQGQSLSPATHYSTLETSSQLDAMSENVEN